MTQKKKRNRKESKIKIQRKYKNYSCIVIKPNLSHFKCYKYQNAQIQSESILHSTRIVFWHRLDMDCIKTICDHHMLCRLLHVLTNFCNYLI